jgi:peptidyl-prolyl cis-trans isomerase A (cyclophilin A)
MMLKSSVVLMLALSVAASAQTSTTKSSTTHKSSTAKKSAAAAPAPTTPAGPPKAIIHTSMGDIHCTLMPDKAPIGVANFVGLATGSKDWTDPKSGAKKHGVPLYDGTIFHRVIPDFMIQGGDPIGNGQGDPGYKFKNETSTDLGFDKPGRLAYANAGPDTNGSQFFVTEAPYPSLNGGYTIFGQCEDPEVVQAIARVPRSHAYSTQDKPISDVTIKHIEIVGAATAKPAAKKPVVHTHHPAAKKSTSTKSTASPSN